MLEKAETVFVKAPSSAFRYGTELRRLLFDSGVAEAVGEKGAAELLGRFGGIAFSVLKASVDMVYLGTAAELSWSEMLEAQRHLAEMEGAYRLVRTVVDNAAADLAECERREQRARRDTERASTPPASSSDGGFDPLLVGAGVAAAAGAAALLAQAATCANHCEAGFRFCAEAAGCCPSGFPVYCPGTNSCMAIGQSCPGASLCCPGQRDCTKGC